MARGALLLLVGIILATNAQPPHIAQPAEIEGGTEPVGVVEGVLAGDVDVPCSVFPNDPKDKVNLILWYKDHNEVPIYSYDRRRAMFPREKHHLKEGSLQGRVEFTPSPRPPRPHYLKIKGLQASDAGLYTCRVDFLNAQSTTRTAQVAVITPVESVVITDSHGQRVPPKTSPIPEGGTLNLTCMATGGNPRPKVSWWLGDAMVDDTSQLLGSGVQRNTLLITPVTRSHIHAVLSCRASASPVAVMSDTVTIDMYLKPLSVDITGGAREGIKAGEHLDLTCKTRGSRPSPRITWSVGGVEKQTVEPQQKGSVTDVGVESHLRLVVRRRDHGSRVACKAVNPDLPKFELQDHITLNVTYPPEVELRMRVALDGNRVKEHEDLYLLCHTDANPPPHTIHFQHENRPLVQDSNTGVVIAGSKLLLKKVTRAQAGLYSCNATNTVGPGKSAPINITVLYAPVCSGTEDVWAEPGKPVTAQCNVQAEPVTPVTFSWVWSASTTTWLVDSGYITVKGLSSEVRFTAPRENSSVVAPGNVLGMLECWAKNPVGTQAKPCIIRVKRPRPPEPPVNCTLSAGRNNTVVVRCDPGASVLPQTYGLKVLQGETGIVFLNVTSNTPRFTVSGLHPGYEYLVFVSAHTKYGRSRLRKVEGLRVKTAENKMSDSNEDESFLVDSEWFSLVVYGGGGLGIVLFILLIACLVRLRLRRSQHKCTVRKIRGAAIPEDAGQPPAATAASQPAAVRSRSSESQSLSSSEKKSPNIDGVLGDLGPPGRGDVGRTDGGLSRGRYDDNTLQPIIRQGGSKRQPIIKENGRAEPIRGSQNRQVLFLEPPVAHQNEIPSPRRVPEMVLPPSSRDFESPPYGPSDIVRPLEPPMRRSDSITRHVDISPHRHPDMAIRRPDIPMHSLVNDRHDMPPAMRDIAQARHDIHDYSMRHGLGPRVSDPTRFDELPPRHVDYDVPPYTRRRLCSDSIKYPPGEMDSAIYPPSIRNTSYHESLRNFEDRYSDRQFHPDVHQPHFSGSSTALTRDPGYCPPNPRSHPGVFTSPAYRRYARSYDECSSPQPPLTSIMKKSPSVSAGVGRHYDPGRGSHPTYRSLPRPGKTRAPDIEDLNRYRSLDRRFDLPFTGSLPRPEPRRPVGGSRLRFSDAKYFHVYPDKDKKQNRVVVDDADENFV